MQKGNFGVDTIRRHIYSAVQIFFNLSRMGHTHIHKTWRDRVSGCSNYTATYSTRSVCACVRTRAHTLKDHHSSPQIKHAHLHTVSDQGCIAHNKEGSSQFMQNHKDHHCTMHYKRVTPQYCSKYDAMYDVGVALHTPTQLPQWAFPQRQSGALPGWQGVEASPPSGRTQ